MPAKKFTQKNQSVFTRKLAVLILLAYSLGYEITLGDTWAINLWPVIDLLNKAMAYLESSSGGAGVAGVLMPMLKKMKKILMPHTHSRKSYHYHRMAADLNLFKAGKYLTRTEDHRPLGEAWVKMGGTWGGNFSSPDGNHYSWGEGR